VSIARGIGSRVRWSLALLCVAVGSGLLACAGGSGARPEFNAPAPDWMSSGGKTPRYPKARFVTGFAMVELPASAGGIDAAKQQAAAALSRNISVRIQASLRDVTESRNGTDSYAVASIVNSTSDILLSGLDYEIYPQRERSYALAYLERGRVLGQRRSLRGRSLEEVRVCLSSGERHEAAGRQSDAIETYGSCRGPIAQALEHDSVARALGASAAADDAAYRELVAANRKVDEKVKTILRSPASSLSEAIERLAMQLRRQDALTSGRLTVPAFTYGTTDLSSVFGQQASVELESALARSGAGSGRDNRVVRGVYLERADDVLIAATVKSTDSGLTVTSASTTLPKRALPSGVSLKPANFEQALRNEKLLGEGELIGDDLQVEVWTARGRRAVVYNEGQDLEIHYRVNQPAYVRFLYVLANGAKVPLDRDAIYVDASKVNQVITYPDKFEVVPPFGVEHIHATAFTSQPPTLVTQRQVFEGEVYDIIADEQIVRTRGIRRQRQEKMSESLVTVTTMP
jgi:hypothetical protein